MKHIYIITGLICLLPIGIKAQSNSSLSGSDSTSLSGIITRVISSYPSIIKAEQDIEYANARIGLAKSAKNPNVDLSASYSHIGPTSEITIPEMGTFSLYPADNYSAAINYNQVLFDFGKTDKNVALENLNKELAQLSIEQLKQRLSMSLAGNYYTIVFLREAIAIKDQELANLNEHLLFVKKKAATGSATEYEILTTQVRISNIENQKTDLLTSLKIQSGQLNSFLGEPQENKLLLKRDILSQEVVDSQESLINLALSQRDEMKILQQRGDISAMHSKLVDAQNNPVINLFATGGIKNGYIPNLSAPKINYAAGFGFKLPIYDASRSKYNKMQVKAEITSLDQDSELAKRSIVNEVVENRANVESALKKVKQSELQLSQAVKAYSLAETSFKAGVITNLDLLDSSTALSESKLFLMKTRVDYTLSLIKLKISLGERIY